MTIISKNNTDSAELKELLIKNLPTVMKAGNEKFYSNIREYKTVTALLKCKFINFNSINRVSFMVFDIDHYREMRAIDHFKETDVLSDYILEKIGLEPTYILKTEKGFHFAYHLKNHVYMHQAKAVEYLRNIKIAITKLLGCDINGSHRLRGVWRNPLLHEHTYSEQINYELSDFKSLLPEKRESFKKVRKTKVSIDDNQLVVGNRNNYLFACAMRFAKGFSVLDASEILDYLIETNTRCETPLERDELQGISASVHIYWSKGTIRFGTLPTEQKIINEGIMAFPTMSNLSFEEYEAETKRRQRLSAQRTNEIRDQEKASAQLIEARRISALKRQIENQKKICEAVKFLEDYGIKVSVSSISRKAKINMRTVSKYY